MWNLSWGNVFTSLPSDMIRHLGSPMRSWSKYLNIQGNKNVSISQVSWVRHPELAILSHHTTIFTTDTRFAVHLFPRSGVVELRIHKVINNFDPPFYFYCSLFFPCHINAPIPSIHFFHLHIWAVLCWNILQCAFSSVYNDIIVLFAKPFNIRRAQNLANRCTWTPPTYYFSLHPTSHPCAALGGALGGAKLHSAQHF